MPTVSEALAQIATELRFEDLPPEVVAKAKLHVLDTLGVALAAARLDFGAAARQVAEDFGGPPTCSVIGSPRRLPGVWAAFVNGVLAHGLDYDDTHAESVVHVNATVTPAALAACEEANAGGRTFLTAVALGMEANIRLGLVAPGAFHDRGFHPTGVCGAYASALVAGKVASFDAAALANALGLAGSQASGTMEFLTDGTWSKRLHAGWAAHGGLVAARLAAAGYTGPRATLEGRFGLYRSHLGAVDVDLSVLTRGWHKQWHLLETSLKPYPCCHMTHAFIDCAAALQQAHRFRLDSIERIECFIHPREVPVVCEPQAGKHDPQTDYDAKFSLPYCVASMLVRGHVELDDFTETAIRESPVLALAHRIVYRDDPQNDYPLHFGGWMRVHLRGGKVVEHREPINRGHADKPLSDEAVREKFRANAKTVLSEGKIEQVVDAIGALDHLPTIDSLTQPLRGGNS
ncbi:MAG: MmgE/PrpD family protein [Deltaproteobacteria bacterium]|nr:MmgE/PrpD family protein [Deltaproteobacteria bacterium]